MIKPFQFTSQMRRGLIRKLSRSNAIVKFNQEPLLCSLVTCLGLKHEWGQPQADRLSYWLDQGSDLSPENYNVRLIDIYGNPALSIEMKDGTEIQPRHPDFKKLISPFSTFGSNGLKRLIFSPMEIYENYFKEGLELVIVRDWALSSFLNPNGSQEVYYLQTNRWEVENLTALTQAELMLNQQIAFSGTHDIADHLLGGSVQGYRDIRNLLVEVDQVFSQTLQGIYSHPTQLVLAYLIGVLLDDLAQPRWYNHLIHKQVIQMALVSLKEFSTSESNHLFLPQSFHELVEAIRDRQSEIKDLRIIYSKFALDIGAQKESLWTHSAC